uniref:SulP family inorganic anion transporter n=1 Tax=Acetatifactor sp. TaxID=1872090 RepID=UPI0040576AF6
MNHFEPKIVYTITHYSKEQFFKDVFAGIIVAIIALPLNIAFALGAGVSAEKGVFAAIIASIICGLLGGSRVQISGPTGAFIVIIQSVIAGYGLDGLAISMIIAGIILVLLGLFRLGGLIRYIPAPITTGFTAGIGVTIFTLEVKDFLGLTPESMPTKFVEKWTYYFSNLDKVNVQSVILSLVCIVILVIWPKINKKIPNSLVAIVVGTLAAQLLNLDVKLLGEIPKTLGAPVIPEASMQTIIDLMSPSFTIAILIAMQALLSTVVTDGMINSRTNSSMELIAQGIANIVLAFFGCIPTTGGVARGVQSAKNGARTPIAAIVHSAMLFIFLIALMPLIKLVPLCVLAAILMVVSYNMLNVKVLKGYLKAPKSDFAVLIASCLLTFAFDLIFAIEVGMIMSLVLFMRRMAEVTDIKEWEAATEGSKYDLDLKEFPEKTAVYEITGPLFFGAADTLKKIVVDEKKNCFIIRMRGVGTIDATAMNYLESLYDDCKAKEIQIIFSHVNEQPLSVMKKSGFYDKVGSENFCAHIDEALKRAQDLQ